MKRFFYHIILVMSILQPLNRQKVEYEFYHIDDDFLPILKGIKEKEVVLYINYYGVLNSAVSKVIRKYKNVIIDASQAFYYKPKINSDIFYSPRKFFGIPDGGFAYTREDANNNNFEVEKSISRINHLLLRVEEGAEAGYEKFLLENEQLNDIPIRAMSDLTEKLLRKY